VKVETPGKLLKESSPDVLVKVENVVKRFGNFPALKGISFQLKKGEVLGFLGPNGAGKTTAMRILTGYFPPSTGRVLIDGREFSKNPKKLKKNIGYLPEVVRLYSDMRVIEFLEFAARVKGVSPRQLKSHLDVIMQRCGLGDMRFRLIGKLSKGYRQRVGLAQALCGNPDVLILDEPTGGLDPKQIVEFRELIRELGREKTLILSTHILPEVHMLCDRVIILNEGQIVASGTADELGSGLQTRNTVSVIAGRGADINKAVPLLQNLEGVDGVDVMQKKEDQITFSIKVAAGKDLRAQISQLFVENQIPLLEIRSEQMSLEDIFMKLVDRNEAE